ncbi:hypothetical protein JCM10212_006875 [Sporobolomyces blumeae]
MPIVRLALSHTAEGVLTLDALARLVRSTALNPLLTSLPLLYAVCRAIAGPVGGVEGWPHFLALVKHVDWTKLGREQEVTAALALFGAGIVCRVNEQLNRGARNNFARGDGWNGENEVVVITGGAGGLGRVVCSDLCAKGIKVVAFDAAPRPAGLPAEIAFYQIDVSNPDKVREAATAVRTTLGAPTVLVNMAGIVRAKSILDLSKRDIDLTYDVNVKAQYYTVQEVLPEMIAKGHGHIVTIASSTAYHAAATGVSYCSSKAAALSFHEGLTEELRHVYQPTASARKIRTSVVCPAHIKTDMFTGFKNDLPRWVAPGLEVDTVAKLVVETIMSGESQHIIEPFYAKVMPLARGWPTWIYGAVLACAKNALKGVVNRDAQAGYGTFKADARG